MVIINNIQKSTMNDDRRNNNDHHSTPNRNVFGQSFQDILCDVSEAIGLNGKEVVNWYRR